MANGLIQKSYVSSLSSVLDAREIYDKLIDVQRDESFMSWLTDMDAKAIIAPSQDPSQMPIYYSFQNDVLTQMLDTTGATVAGSGTATVTVTALTTNNQNVVKVGDLLKWSGGVARVQTTPLASSFTATSVDGTNLTLVAGASLSIFSNAQEEGATAPASQRWGVTSISNQIQIFENSTQLTDVQMQSGIEFQIDGKWNIIPFEAWQLRQMHRLQMSAGMFMGKMSTTQFSDTAPTLTGVNGRGVQTTRGLTEYIASYGVNDTLTTPGTMTLADINDTTVQLTAARSPRKYAVEGSIAVITLYSNFFKNLPSSGTLNSVRMMVNGREIDMMVERAMFNGFEVNLHEAGLLNNAQIVGSGATLLSEAKKAYWIPLGKVNTVKNGMAPYVRYRYLQPSFYGTNSGNRTTDGITTETIVGGLAPVSTDNTNLARITHTTYAGLEIFDAKAFAGVTCLA